MASKPVNINTLVIVDREHARMSPELHYALKKSAKNKKLNISFNFKVFNPLKIKNIDANQEYKTISKDIYALIDQSIPQVVEIKKQLTNKQTMSDALFSYIDNHPKEKLYQAKSLISKLMCNYDVLIIEPTGSTVVHPVFYNKETITLDGLGANKADLIETIYAFLFLDYAIKHNMPVIGMCHGAQIGYIYFGGSLQKIFNPSKTNDTTRLYFQKNKYGGPIEAWNIGGFLNNRHWKDPSKIRKSKYPLPVFLKKSLGLASQYPVFINKEILQTLAMIMPVPDGFKIYTKHPLSRFNKKQQKYGIKHSKRPAKYHNISKDNLSEFSSSLCDRLVVDFYHYKTMFATQYHPQYL